MLARNAEALYWIGRYVERADDTARILDVTVHQLLEDSSVDPDHASRILLWNLKLHLRLEERWLDRWGCLCHGHHQAHRDASTAALEGWLRCDGDRGLRLAWLEALRTWFVAHRDGADARAYSLAHAASQP